MVTPDLERIEHAIDYLKLNVDKPDAIADLEDWVYEDMTWTPIEIGQAISVEGSQYLSEDEKDRETLLHAFLAVKLAAESPISLGGVERWKRSAIPQPDERLRAKLGHYLGQFQSRLAAPKKVQETFEPAQRLHGKLLVVGGRLTPEFLKLIRSWAKRRAPDLLSVIHDKLRFTPVYRMGRQAGGDGRGRASSTRPRGSTLHPRSLRGRSTSGSSPRPRR
ncbi:MAG: hypothetical protein ACE5F1_07650 [Planctomycetota bacterium]